MARQSQPRGARPFLGEESSQLILLGPKTWDLETAIAIEPLLLTELLPTFVRRLWGATARRQATTRASPKAAQLWPYPGGLSRCRVFHTVDCAGNLFGKGTYDSRSGRFLHLRFLCTMAFHRQLPQRQSFVMRQHQAYRNHRRKRHQPEQDPATGRHLRWHIKHVR